MNKKVAKILDGVITSILFVFIMGIFIFTFPEIFSNYAFLYSIIFGFIAGYFKLFGGIFQNEK